MLKNVKKKKIQAEELVEKDGKKVKQTVEKVVGEDINFKYNGMTKLVKAGEVIDIRDFSQPKSPIQTEHVAAIEKRLVTKYPDTWEIKKTTGDPAQDKVIDDRIKTLEKENESLRKSLDEERKVNADLTDKFQATTGSIQTLKNEIASLKKENDSLSAKFKDQEDEIQKLREQVAGGGKRGKK